MTLTARCSWRGARAPASPAPLVVLLHGYGAHEHDLVPLTAALPATQPWASLRAPVEAPGGGAEWFPIEALAAPDPGDLHRAAGAVWDWLDGHAVPRTRIVPIGFSQGGVMALELLRERPDQVAAAAVLSGFAAPGLRPADDQLAAKRVPVFWGRGDRDEIIPPEAITHTAAWLPEHSRLEAHVYPGLAHGISSAETADLGAFLLPVLTPGGRRAG